MGRLQRAVVEIGEALGALYALYFDPDGSAETGGASGRRSAEPPGSPALVNVHIDALAGEIRDVVERCAYAVTDALGTDMPGPVGYFFGCRQLVEDHLDLLVAAPPSEHMQWNRAGTEWDHVVFDGPELAIKLVDLHRRARIVVGLNRGRDRMPVPCPRCEAPSLGRDHGDTIVDCQSCGSSWTETDYRRLTLVLADDLEAAHERPKPRERHLSRPYKTIAAYEDAVRLGAVGESIRIGRSLFKGWLRRPESRWYREQLTAKDDNQ